MTAATARPRRPSSAGQRGTGAGPGGEVGMGPTAAATLVVPSCAARAATAGDEVGETAWGGRDPSRYGVDPWVRIGSTGTSGPVGGERRRPPRRIRDPLAHLPVARRVPRGVGPAGQPAATPLARHHRRRGRRPGLDGGGSPSPRWSSRPSTRGSSAGDAAAIRSWSLRHRGGGGGGRPVHRPAPLLGLPRGPRSPRPACATGCSPTCSGCTSPSTTAAATGELLSRANTDLQQVQNLVVLVPLTISNAVTVLAVTVDPGDRSTRC